MKTLLVITRAELGGAQTFLLSLARGLKKNGMQVAIAAGDGDFLPSELGKEKIPFFYLKTLKRNSNPLSIFSFIIELRRLLKREEFDVVHFNSTNTLPGALAAKLLRRKILTVFTVHGLSVIHPSYKAPKILKVIFKKYFKFFLSYVNRIVFVSNHDFTESAAQGIAGSGELIYNGLEINSNYFLSRNEARSELEKVIKSKIEDAYLIGSIGRLAEVKNYDFLIRNWLEIKKIRPNARLIIIGEGPERVKYEKIVKEGKFSDDIYFPGENRLASKLLKGFDLFILPSIFEGLSISLIEALFAEIPVLASNVGGNMEIVGDDNCFVLGDDEDFFNKLKMVDIPKIDTNLFVADDMVKKYQELYERG